MDLGAVAVVAVFIGLAGGEVEGTADFFVEEDIAHGLQDIGVDTEGKFADVAGAFIGVEDFVEGFFVAVAVGFDDFAVLEGEADAIEGDALEEGGGGVVDGAVHAVFDGGSEDFAIGDVHFAGAGVRGHAFDGEAEVGAGAGDADAIGAHHAGGEFVHGNAELGVVCQAAAEVEVFECFGAHAGSLGHAGGGPAQDTPFGFADAVVVHRAHVALGQGHFVGGDAGVFEAVVAASDGDVGIHGLHFGEFKTGDGGVLFIGGTGEHFAGDAAVAQVDVGVGSGGADGADEFDADFIGGINDFEQDVFAGLHTAGVADEVLGKLCGARIGHGE